MTSSHHHHYTRLIEITAGLERGERYVDDPELSSTDLRGVGVSEAPRGTLFHDYTVDRDGVIRKVNLLVATVKGSVLTIDTSGWLLGAFPHASQAAG